MRLIHMTIRSAAIVLLLLTIGCASNAWRSARNTHSISAYEEFLQRYPNTEFSSEARRQLDSLRAEERRRQEASAYDAATRAGTSEAVEAFLTRHPDGALKAQAEALLRRFARLVAKVPESINSVDPFRKHRYVPLSGPVWVYRVTFQETAGVGVELTQCELRIPDVTYGSYKTGQSSSINPIRIPPNGSGFHESWVRGESLRGNSLGLYFRGKDDNGNPVRLHVSSQLK
jgi:hypothetical protein